MKPMFTSATIKLTSWYLLILMVISLSFSIIIFELSTNEISSRLERLQIRVENTDRTLTLPGPLTLNDIRMNQTREARTSIFVGLVYLNLAVLGLGGIGSYLLARRTLRPIENAHEAQSRFTSDASHELKTPLAVMKSEIQVALRDPKVSKAEMRELLESNLEEVDKLTNLSSALLQLSRFEFQQLERSQSVNVSRLISSQVKAFGGEASRIDVSLPKQPVMVEGNESMLGDLIRILLDNALKYSPPGGNVDISMTGDGRHCKIFVTNSGDGIAESDLPHIFERFYRADRARTSTSERHGYGLGLALAKNIVDLHDGTIRVTSTPHELTLFTVSLPQVRKNR